ncbi:MAG: neutral zinc metallopeptidase [Gammaproteobacteria bacterium]
MRLGDEDESSNIEDRRGWRGGGGRGGLGIGGVVLVLAVSYFTGIDPRVLLGVAEQASGSRAPAVEQRSVDPAQDPQAALKREMARVLRKTETSWDALFQQMGGRYQPPTLVLFRGATPTACGTGQAAMGPFYCPADRKVYLDMAFFTELERRFGAGGDFARAYVIAHEVGHHVQNLLGISEQAARARRRMSEVEYNKLSVRIELQADCFAGVWAEHANRARPFLEPGDVAEALTAANAIGDDMLQKQARGVVVPDSFTHGTSAERMQWFKTGFERGDPKACNTI